MRSSEGQLYVFGYRVSKGLDMGFIMRMDGYLGLYFRHLWFRVYGSVILLRFYMSIGWVVYLYMLCFLAFGNVC